MPKNTNTEGERIRIRIRSTQYDLDGMGSELIFSEDGTPAPRPTRVPEGEGDEAVREKPSSIELDTDGLLRERDGRIEISYDETELTGMEGSTTAISFDPNEPGLVTMLRDGTVRTVLIFEEGRRHICVYETEYLPFELCIHAYKVANGLTWDGGRLSLDYVIEVRGSASERTRFTLEAVRY